MYSPSSVVAIFGPPGVGKTTAARALSEAMSWPVVSSGDVARIVDPEALARGEMADRAKLATGFVAALEAEHEKYETVIVDGLPRDPTDVGLLPADTCYILLNCRPDIAIERQLRRAREGDTPETIRKRSEEQRALMGMHVFDGWSFKLATWERALTTERLTREQMIEHVVGFVKGERKTVG